MIEKLKRRSIWLTEPSQDPDYAGSAADLLRNARGVVHVQVASSDHLLVSYDVREITLQILEAGGWTTLTAVCLLIFSLCHNPCSTTIYTIWRETRSVKWTVVASVLPLVPGVALCALVAFVWRSIAGG